MPFSTGVLEPMTLSIVPLTVRDLGRADYAETLALQHRLVEARLARDATDTDDDGDTLVLVEHPAVITLGRKRDAAAHVLAPAGTPVVSVERGGDVTWHGPGQLVGYPIVLLRPGERDVVRFLRNLERAFVGLASELGLVAFTRDGHTGVWARSAGADP
jgi:lipoyl(octanoyl) transferase